MPSQIELQESFQVGEASVFECPAPSTDNMVVFEDDGESGYFYAVDGSGEEVKILDAILVYEVGNISDHKMPRKLEIVWAADGQKACLVINNVPHVIFDFEARRAYSRSGFPPPNAGGFANERVWDDAALGLFR